MTEQRKRAFLRALEIMRRELRILHEEEVIDNELRRVSKLEIDATRNQDTKVTSASHVGEELLRIVKSPTYVTQKDKLAPAPNSSRWTSNGHGKLSSWPRPQNRFGRSADHGRRIGDFTRAISPVGQRAVLGDIPPSEQPADNGLEGSSRPRYAFVPIEASATSKSTQWTKGYLAIEAVEYGDSYSNGGLKINFKLPWNDEYTDVSHAAPLHIMIVDTAELALWEGILTPDWRELGPINLPGCTIEDFCDWVCTYEFLDESDPK